MSSMGFKVLKRVDSGGPSHFDLNSRLPNVQFGQSDALSTRDEEGIQTPKRLRTERAEETQPITKPPPTATAIQTKRAQTKLPYCAFAEQLHAQPIDWERILAQSSISNTIGYWECYDWADIRRDHIPRVLECPHCRLEIKFQDVRAQRYNCLVRVMETFFLKSHLQDSLRGLVGWRGDCISGVVKHYYRCVVCDCFETDDEVALAEHAVRSHEEEWCRNTMPLDSSEPCLVHVLH